MWNNDEIVAVTNGKLKGGHFKASGVSIDSRTIKKGEMFVAVKGDTMDGHAYVKAAFVHGASAAIVEKGFEIETDKPLIVVEDTMQALRNLAMAARARSNAKIVAVTGSAGKTGTKELLSIALSVENKVHASKKSYNNHWGVPLSLANLPLDADFGVFEVGMNHKGELADLVKMVRPHVAVITTVEPIHIEFFKSVEEIADAKAEIFSSMAENPTAVLNIDNPHFARLKSAAEKAGVQQIWTFGEDEKADVRLIDCTLHSDSSKVTADVMGERVHYKINIPGKHIALNSLSVMAVVKHFGLNVSFAASAIKTSNAVEGRGNRLTVEIVKGEPPVTIINESYNANPSSMLAAFNVFSMVEPEAKGRHIAVLGDMLELGKDAASMHLKLANPLLKAKTDLLFCCGSLMEALYDALPKHWQGAHAKDSQALAQKVVDALKPGDVVLVKGSKGSKMPYVVQAIQNIKPKEKTDAV